MSKEKIGINMIEKKEENKRNYYLNPKKCLKCENILSYEKRYNSFCSHSCSSKSSNVKRKKLKYCKECGKELSTSIKTYCSKKCYHEYTYKENVRKWKEGEKAGCKYGELRQFLREYLFKKYNFSCSKCGWKGVNLKTGKTPLEVHHADGNCTNNEEENLTLLCPNCHSLTETYKSLNKGSARNYR